MTRTQITLRTGALLAAAALNFAVSTSVTGQTNPGALILTASGTHAGLHHGMLNPSPLSKLTTIALNCVTIAEGNRDFIAATNGAPARILRIARGTGTITTLATLPGSAPARGIAPDQDGGYRIASRNAIFRLQPNGLSYSVSSVPVTGEWNAICRDRTTGDFLIGDFASGSLARLNRVTGGITVLAMSQGPNQISALAHNARNGRFVVSRLNTAHGLRIVTPSIGMPVYSTAINDVNAVTIDEATGDIVAATTDGKVIRTDQNGVPFRTHDFGGQVFTGIGLFASRRLSVRTLGMGGLTATLSMQFPRSHGKPYACALSFAARPWIPLGPTTLIPLAADPLFFLTAAKNIPGITQNFTGTTSWSGGTATAEVQIPGYLPSGTVFQAAAAAINPALPGGLEVTNPECVKVWRFIWNP